MFLNLLAETVRGPPRAPENEQEAHEEIFRALGMPPLAKGDPIFEMLLEQSEIKRAQCKKLQTFFRKHRSVFVALVTKRKKDDMLIFYDQFAEAARVGGETGGKIIFS